VDTHDDLVPVYVDVPLHQRHGLAQHVVARANEVNAEDLVVADYAEDALVVALRLLRVELDDDTAL
jgi:hypothetical protein